MDKLLSGCDHWSGSFEDGHDDGQGHDEDGHDDGQGHDEDGAGNQGSLGSVKIPWHPDLQ